MHYGYVVLGMIVLVVLGSLGLGRFGYTIILPTMQDSLGLTNMQAGELQSWNLAGYLIAVVVTGMLAARHGPRVVISVSALLVASAMTLTGLAPTFEVARWARFLTGLGAGGVNVPAMGLIPAWFGAKRRGLASGIAVGGSSLGLMITGPLVPFIIEQYGTDQGWRVSWIALGAMGFIVALLGVVLLRDRPAEMGLQPVGEVDEAQRVAPVSSLDWASVYRSPALWHLAAIYSCFGLSYTIYYTFFGRYLVKEGGLTWDAAGALWFQVGVGTIVSGFIWGIGSDRWGRRAALVIVFVIQGASFLLFGLVKTLPGFFFSAVLFSITAWSVPALMAALSGDLFGARLAPAVLGVITVPFGVGQAIGPVLAGAIGDAAQSFSPAFVIAGVVALCGATGSLALRTSNGPSRSRP